MSHRWQQIWTGREVAPLPADPLEALLHADGFLGGFQGLTLEAWSAWAGSVAALLDIRPGERVADLGCGAGAFLYPLWRRGVRVAGVDYAPGLLATARAAMPDGDFHLAEAAAPPIGLAADHLVSCGVFLYFPDQAYAWRVLDAAFALAGRSVAILDIPDLAARESAEAARRAHLGEVEYRRLYDGLGHLYFDRAEFAARMARPGWKVEVRGQWMEGYFHAPYRFNAWAVRE